jgi:cytochrome c oxidase assembly protein subunit 15
MDRDEHRYFALAVGVLIVVLTIQAWRRPEGVVGRLAVVGERCAALGLRARLFGALTVTMKLQPAIVTLHLLAESVCWRS